MSETQNGDRRVSGPRLIAIVGPFQSGKTSLLEGMLARGGGALRGRARCASGTSIGDSSPEARAHAMSVEPNIAHVDYMGDRMTFVDCPGSVEFMHDMRARAAGLRRRGGGLRGRPAQDRRRCRSSCASSRRCGVPRIPVPQQDRSGRRRACARRWR